MMVRRSHCYCYLFCLIFFLLHTLTSPTLHHDQRDALLEFKNEFFPNFRYNSSANHTLLSSWNKKSDYCSWEGVTCDANSSKVTSLSLISIPLNNSLKPNSSLFKLQYLQDLTLVNCSLHGEIPSSLGNLSCLTRLVLARNAFIGQIPSSLGNLTQLSNLNLGVNKLSGNIPLSFANLTNLSRFNLYDNDLESTLPSFLSRFRNLEYLDVGANSFAGPFPKSLFTIPSLLYVNLTGNRFKGPIEFVNTSSSFRLGHLFLDQNEFDGPIPESISEFLNFQVLDLSYNNFVGSIPRSISKLVKLDFLDVSNNKLVGHVPGSLLGLTALVLSRNSFNSLGKYNGTQPQVLDLQSNSFRGLFPHWICNLRSLRLLDLSNNIFTGPIPQCLWNSTASLGVLMLHNNNFSGFIPDVFSNATKLEAFDVSRNHFEGKLPKSLINCKSLEFLNAESNRIKDEFPFWVDTLPSLNVLILRSNRFFGPLYHNRYASFPSLKVIDVSHNDFAGNLPPFYFSNWREMTNLTGDNRHDYMEDSRNYVGIYRNSMEIVHKGVDTKFDRIRRDFIAIDFSGNKFSGDIPESIGLLKGLRLLNLSHNAFTGKIPRSLANLTNLEALDLSQNQLSGQIPQDLGTLSFLSTMNFSHNNLQGPIPRGTQFQRQNCSSFMNNTKLYGLEEICGEKTDSTPSQEEDFSEPKEQVISWIAAAIAYGPGVFCGLVIAHFASHNKHVWFVKMFRRKKPRRVVVRAR